MTGSRDLRQWLELAVAFLVVGGAALYLGAHRAELSAVIALSNARVFGIVFWVLVSLLASAGQNFVMLRAEGARIGFVENLMLTFAGNLGNYLPMRAGTLIRLRYLKSVHGLRYARYGSIFGIRAVLLLLATGVLGIAGTVGLWLNGRPLSLQLLSLFTALVAGASIGALRPPAHRLAGSGRIVKAVNDFSHGFEAIRSRPRVSSAVFALLLIQFIALGWRMLLTFRSIGIDPELPLLMLLSPLATLVSFTAITPGGLGLREAVMGWAALVTGLDFDSGFFAGAVDRAVMLAVVGALGVPGLLYCWKRVRAVDDLAEPER